MRNPAEASDPRARRSRAALEGALLELVRTRPLRRVSAGDIVMRAGVSRSTLYEHYRDLSDLAASAAESAMDELASRTPALGRFAAELETPPYDSLTGMFDHLRGHASLYGPLLGPDGDARVIDLLRRRFTAAAYVAARREHDDGSMQDDHPLDTPWDPAAALFGGASLGLVSDWLARGCPGTSRELADAVWPLLVAMGDAAAGEM